MIQAGDIVNNQNRAEYIEMLSYKGFTSDKLSNLSNKVLENLYVEYVICADDYL